MSVGELGDVDSRLPSTRDEVVAVIRVLAGKRLLLGPDATEAAFKAQPLADFEIMHIAAHGIASAQFLGRSFSEAIQRRAKTVCSKYARSEISP